MGLDQLPADEELHHRLGNAHVGGLVDVPPRHRVQHLADPGVDIRADLRSGPGGQHERILRQRLERLLLGRGEHDGRGRIT
jgi:hypothetical protein